LGIIGGEIGYRMLRVIAPRTPTEGSPTAPTAVANDLVMFFGPDFFDRIRGKTVIDFGCGNGKQSVAMALNGAKQVIGLDIQTRLLKLAEELAARHGVTDRCRFTDRTDEQADIVITKDTFEHFADPAAVLGQMAKLVKPDGLVLASFGPTWYHPYGGHLFSIFPWAHLVFTERALLRWRSRFKNDGAASFGEVAGGLNRMTIRRFERIVAESPFRFAGLEAVPIRGLGFLRSRLLREIGTSFVRCELVPKRIIS